MSSNLHGGVMFSHNLPILLNSFVNEEYSLQHTSPPLIHFGCVIGCLLKSHALLRVVGSPGLFF